MIKIKLINYISVLAVPLAILIIISFGMKEKKNVFDLFLNGAKKGLEITITIFPTLIGLFFSIGLLNNSGIIDYITKLIEPILSFVRFPKEILPLALLRPISGSASLAIATDIIKNNGVDSIIGLIASVIMGSTETTLYTITVYCSCLKIKNTRKIIIPAILADITGIIVSILIFNIIFP